MNLPRTHLIMPERIFNLFLEIKDGMIFELGAVFHKMDGSDEVKLAFLQRQVQSDLQVARRYPIPKRYWVIDGENLHKTSALNYDTYIALSQEGKHLEVFEEIFEDMHAPADPLVVITPIVDGSPKVDIEERF